MQFLNLAVLLSLAASVTAIDISLRTLGNCNSNNGGHTCTNMNPENCCGIASGSRSSAVIFAIPTWWHISFRGHEGGRCGRVRSSETFNGVTSRCLNNGPYTGAGYSLLSSSKRGGPLPQEDACSASDTCSSSVEPDQLFLADGQKYNIVGMEAGLYEELNALMENGTVTADIPAVFKAFEISA